MQTSGKRTYGAQACRGHGAASGRRSRTAPPKCCGANGRYGLRGNRTEQSYCRRHTSGVALGDNIQEFSEKRSAQEAHSWGDGEQSSRGTEASKEVLTTFLSKAQ